MTAPIEPATPIPTRRPRKPLRITLGALMVLVLVIGGGLGWIAHRARVQRDAVAAIREIKGVAWYNGQTRASKQAPDSGVRGSKWLRDLLGADAFDTVTFVGVGGIGASGPCDDRLMAHVGDLDGLKGLQIQPNAFSSGLTSAGMSRIRDLTRLESLSITGPEEKTSGFLPFIGNQNQLRRLRLQQAVATDDDMARIGGLTEMENLYLDGRKVTDRGFASLAKLTKMKQLELSRCIVTDLSPVAGMTNLDRLFLGDGYPYATSKGLKTVSLEPLRGKSKLSDLVLGNIPTDDAGLEVVAALPALIVFHTGGRGITEKGLAALSTATKVESLQLRETSIRDLRPFGSRIAQLGTLDLLGSPITDDGLAPLAGTSQMGSLHLSQTDIGDAGLAHLRAMSKLSRLWLNGTRLTDAGLAHLAGLTSLQLLWLRGTRVTGDGLSHLVGLKRLTTLDVSKTALADEGLASVIKIRSLTSLSLGDTQITDEGLARLAALPGLQSLSLDRTRVTDAGLAYLADMPRLISISLGGPSFTDAGLAHLTDLPGLIVISLGGPRFTDAGLVHVAKIRGLRYFRLYGTRITDAGLARLKAELPGIQIITDPPPEGW